MNYSVEWKKINADEYYTEYYKCVGTKDIDGIFKGNCKITYIGNYPILKRIRKTHQSLYRKKVVRHHFYRNIS